MPQIVEVKHLSKTFTTKEGQVDALRDINLSIEKGDIYGIIGMSGAGKSTLVRCLNFLEVPTSGQVIVEGQDLGSLTDRELRALRSSIGMIFQSFNLLMQKSVLDNVCFPLQIQGIRKKDAAVKARELLKTVGLEDKEKAYPAQLSGGQRQRVAIARALACDPKILLCDEATSALDPQTTASILDLLKKINAETGITIIIITHQPCGERTCGGDLHTSQVQGGETAHHRGEGSRRVDFGGKRGRYCTASARRPQDPYSIRNAVIL